MSNDPFDFDGPVKQSKPVDPIDAMQSRLDATGKMLDRVVEWISKQEAKQEEVQPVRVEPERRRPVQRKPEPQGRAKTPPAWGLFQLLVIAILVGIVIFQAFRHTDSDAQAKADAYSRAVQSVQIISQKMAEGLYTVASDLESEKIKTKQETGERLKSVIRAALDAASDSQLQELDKIDPWDGKSVSQRILGAADGYSDTAGRLK